MARVEDVLAHARRTIGTTESPAGSNRQPFAAEAGHANGQPWCASWVVAMFRRAGMRLPSESAYTPTMADGFRRAGRWHPRDPQPGDVVFFDWPDSKNRIQHVAIVVRANPEDRSITTIEGNTSADDRGSQDNGGGVYQRRRSTQYVVGYGRPAYDVASIPTTSHEEDMDTLTPAAPRITIPRQPNEKGFVLVSDVLDNEVRAIVRVAKGRGKPAAWPYIRTIELEAGVPTTVDWADGDDCAPLKLLAGTHVTVRLVR